MGGFKLTIRFGSSVGSLFPHRGSGIVERRSNSPLPTSFLVVRAKGGTSSFRISPEGAMVWGGLHHPTRIMALSDGVGAVGGRSG